MQYIVCNFFFGSFSARSVLVERLNSICLKEKVLCEGDVLETLIEGISITCK